MKDVLNHLTSIALTATIMMAAFYMVQSRHYVTAAEVKDILADKTGIIDVVVESQEKILQSLNQTMKENTEAITELKIELSKIRSANEHSIQPRP